MTSTQKGGPGAPRSNSDKPTLRTIAEITGLAVTTVSRALGGAPQIALETRQRVQRVADEIGYLPDRAAQRLRTGRTNVISLVLDPHEEILNFGTSIIKGLTEALRGTPYHLVITPHFRNEPPIVPVRYILRNRMADGIIFSRTEPFDARVKLLLEEDFPFVCHGRTELSTPHAYVDFDNERFAYDATKTLIAQGRRKPAILLPPPRFTFQEHMRYGFLKAVRENGAGYEILEGVTLDSPSEAITAHVAERLAEPDPPDGYVLGGEVSALAVMAALTDHGLVPGKDAGIVAKKTSNLFTPIRPQIDTIYEDLMEAGAEMGRLLLKRIGGTAPDSLQTLHRPEAR
ncbi:LacI family transcriptional regulator [Chelativorans sp. M5D2P16]|uniref:LacI family transcriptional regulator n=1 Tax=Chelativorans sp. M5D2P16 TaxID=3095678 RepID=UPI002ACA6176|nr:LacI family transcriptional regulator [Chelativorans sp. M5D2P16]MDZ5695999.1 LacI family transcriptional regulator [Chelativorans sp. M5D2P16]